MMRQITWLSLLMIYFSGFRNIQANPLPADEEHNYDSENVQTVWKMCPTYGSFYGDVANDAGCCLDESTCSDGLIQKESSGDKHLPKLLRQKRFKRSIHSGDTSRDKSNYNFGNFVTTRNSGTGDNPKELMEVSLCESKKIEVIQPVFGTAYGSRKPVQIYQIEPFLIQSARLDWCDEKPTAFLHGECRQRFEPQEMFIVSRNSSDTESIGIDRTFVAVPMGCSVYIDPTQILNILSRQQEASANRAKALIKAIPGTSVNYPSYSMNNKLIPRDYRDLIFNDEPAQQSLVEEDGKKTEQSQTSQMQETKQNVPGKISEEINNEHDVPAAEPVQDSKRGETGRKEDAQDKVVDKKGRNPLEVQSNKRGNLERPDSAALGLGSTVTRTDGAGNDSGKRRNKNGGGTIEVAEFHGENRNHEPDRPGDGVQTSPSEVNVPVYFGTNSDADPVQHFLKERETAAKKSSN